MPAIAAGAVHSLQHRCSAAAARQFERGIILVRIIMDIVRDSANGKEVTLVNRPPIVPDEAAR